jgi:hypothetical protein
MSLEGHGRKRGPVRTLVALRQKADSRLTAPSFLPWVPSSVSSWHIPLISGRIVDGQAVCHKIVKSDRKQLWHPKPSRGARTPSRTMGRVDRDRAADSRRSRTPIETLTDAYGSNRIAEI